jgi:hypothetical protein
LYCLRVFQNVSIEKQEKEITMAIVINYEQSSLFHVASKCVRENILQARGLVFVVANENSRLRSSSHPNYCAVRK